jgi:DHA1 family bicyclomycin/chloramphenicol resistance-like MFS transporter
VQALRQLDRIDVVVSNFASPPPSIAAHPPLWLLVAISSCGPFALNLFVPSLPRLAETFETDYGTAQLALTLFLVGIAVGQPIYGPLSDCYGRRPVLLGGLGIGLAGSLLCLTAPTIDILLAGRFLQAFGCCVGMVLARAIVRDLYPRDRAASELAYVTMGMSLMPMIAPSIGGLLDENFGWRASFVVLLAFVFVVALAAVWSASETNSERAASVDFGHLARGWSELVRSPVFLGYTLSTTFNTVSFFGFLAVAPYLMVTVMGRPPSEYGFWFVGCAGSYLVGNFLTARYTQAIGLDRMARFGNLVSLPATAFGLVWAVFFDLQVWALFLPIIAIGFAHGFSQPNLISGAVSVNPRLAGSASGLLGFIQMASGAFATFVLGHVQDGTSLPLASLMFGCALLSLAAHIFAMRARLDVAESAKGN